MWWSICMALSFGSGAMRKTYGRPARASSPSGTIRGRRDAHLASSRRMTRRRPPLCLSAEAADEVLGARREVGEDLAHGGQPGAQLGVPHLDRRHRVLQLDQDRLGLLDRLDGDLEE